MVTVSYGRLISISIHSPYTGRDSCEAISNLPKKIFQSTLPIQGETAFNDGFAKKLAFQSTLPIQGETGGILAGSGHGSDFNPLSLYRERLNTYRAYASKGAISIHSPYTGRDAAAGPVHEPAGVISIHSPYTGRDNLMMRKIHLMIHFNPLSLYRERLQPEASIRINWHFNPLSLYRERLRCS